MVSSKKLNKKSPWMSHLGSRSLKPQGLEGLGINHGEPKIHNHTPSKIASFWGPQKQHPCIPLLIIQVHPMLVSGRVVLMGFVCWRTRTFFFWNVSKDLIFFLGSAIGQTTGTSFDARALVLLHIVKVHSSQDRQGIPLKETYLKRSSWMTGWWFQPIWKILVKLEIFTE